jgi:hypothetical protein
MQKRTMIKKIKSIIKEFGSFTTADIEAESSPCILSRKGINVLCESFYYDNVEAVTYDRHDEEIETERINYEDLKKDVLEEILTLAEFHEVESLQTEKRCSN